MDPSAAYDLLVDGVQDWDLTGDSVPCELLLIGETAFPVMVNPRGQVLIAASQYGKGRMVVISHESYLGSPKMSRFLRNAVGWLSPSPGVVVGVQKTLSSLVGILSSSGTQVQPSTELIASFGVYCMDAYDAAQGRELIQFVKRGGGLLIAGQAWHWASGHSAERVLFDFPGNHVTSVGGVYFTDIYGERGIFSVSDKVPAIPLIAPHGLDFSRDLNLLLKGVSELDIVTDGVPSHLLVHGTLAFPLGLDGTYRCFLAAAHYGRGRVVVATHEVHLSTPKLTDFILNAIHWLGAEKKGRIGINPNLKNLHDLLTQRQVVCEISELTDNLSIYCCQSYSDNEAKKIHEFVAEGGGLLIGGQAWWWASQNEGRNVLAEYPGNKILNGFGISILGETKEAGKYPVLRPEEQQGHYHFRRALAQFQQHLDKKEDPQPPVAGWLQKLSQDCAKVLQIPVKNGHIYASLYHILYMMVQSNGIPPVSKEHAVKGNSKEVMLLHVAAALCQSMSDCARLALCELPTVPSTTVEINCTNTEAHLGLSAFQNLVPKRGEAQFSCLQRSSLFLLRMWMSLILCDAAWRSTGLYLPRGNTVTFIFPSTVTGVGLQVQIGCHSDDLSRAEELKRPPVVIHRCDVKDQKISVSSLWGGLIYIIVPKGSLLGGVSITVKGAVQAPFFRLGKTSKSQWLTCIRHYPAPWAELATQNISLTVPADSIRPIEDPEPLLTLWEQIMTAVAKLAATPAKFPRPERIVADVQISAGWMHAGYPVMCHLDSVKELVNMEYMQANGLWGPIHELGHNQQQAGWEFPPHTTEATCNLWSVYVHEKVLGISRDRAHEHLQLQHRKKRISDYLGKGAQLKDWNVWTALETYLQLQEAFGWEPFIQLFSEYQTMSNIPTDNPSKMNLWAEKFSRQVKKNLAPFFVAWGWPIKGEISKKLASLPNWDKNPMKKV
ncbi:LOW QUALITY PROTEIN: TRPM8 channel-associated factor 2-like [Caretta caretta]|uniref:LOW QUALITY PROTEIN: TRPM8 channel-associated factor 2-like n=1 Tax=Caretta caretta TaxID=8467 RepID=UPI003F4B0303